MHRSVLIAAATVLVTAMLTVPLQAQNPDLMLTKAERDSVLKTYDNVFPLLGRKAIERGFDIPKPFGLNIIGFYADQNIDIGNLGLSTNDNPITPTDFIGFGTNTSSVATVNLRADLWVLPFLNVYVLGGAASANTTVEVAQPISFTTSVDQKGTYFGTGLTAAFGIKRFFMSVDNNWTWINLENLDKAVQGSVLGLRAGRAFKVGTQSRLAFWVGAMRQKIASGTTGSIVLSELIPPETVDQIRNELETVEDEEWYQDLGPAQKAVIDEIVDKLLTDDGSDLTVNYSIDKSISDPWNMLVGSNYDIDKRWTLRGEVGFLGRFSVLLSAVYRMDW